MTLEGSRAKVALSAPADELEMLAEWLQVAGYEPVAADASAAGTDPMVASLVRWPVDGDLSKLPAPVIVLYEPGADLRRLVGIASEAIELPDNRDVRSLIVWSTMLSGVLRHAEELAAMPRQAPAAAPTRLAEDVWDTLPHGSAPPALIAIGISTGGPTSLRNLFDGLCNVSDLPPIAIVQHIPASFVGDLTQRLTEQTGYPVEMATDGGPLMAGRAYVSPGDHHLRVAMRSGRLVGEWDDRPPIKGHMPSVEVLFESCARLKRHGVAVMMTGMGGDGAQAMEVLRDQGWATIGQDEATCTIYGMPRAANRAGAVQRELPLAQIAPWLAAYCHRAAARV